MVNKNSVCFVTAPYRYRQYKKANRVYLFLLSDGR